MRRARRFAQEYCLIVWWARLDSNQGPIGYEPTALPLSYEPRELNSIPPLPTPQHNSAVIS